MISRVRALLGARRKDVWSQKKFVEKLQYMHLNPVKRKLVAHPKDWTRVRALLGARGFRRAVSRSTRKEAPAGGACFLDFSS
jgi:hypothetical protein